MTTTGTPRTSRGTTRPEQHLIGAAHKTLEAQGIELSVCKVRRLVREYIHKVEPHGIPFNEYLAGAVRDVNDHRARQYAGEVLGPDEKSGRATAHNDHPTGETATWNVFVERGY